MKSRYLNDGQIRERTLRNEAFWQGKLSAYPIMWVTAPDPKPGYELCEPQSEEALWTDIEYVLQAAHARLSQTYFAGDSLPVYAPWLGPDQFSAWLGAELVLKPRENTSWLRPLIRDWAGTRLELAPDNRWWKQYLELLKASAEFGKDKWITGYPDLHSGIDAVCALRGPDEAMMDLVGDPDAVRSAMAQMTRLWKEVVDRVTQVIAPYGQGTSNWTMGYSAKRFLCIGQNDFSCLISPEMFEEFCLPDTTQTCRHADYSLYHLDGPAARKHLSSILKIQELTAVQWIPGAGKPPPGQWVSVFRQVQAAGKSVQARYPLRNDLTTAELHADLERLLRSVDVTRLFIWADAPNRAQADALVAFIKHICDSGAAGNVADIGR